MKCKTLAEILEETGKSNCYFADKLNISEQCFVNRVSGKTGWGIAEAFKMAEELNINVDDFVKLAKGEKK